MYILYVTNLHKEICKMGNRSIAVHEYRQIIVRMRLGESDRTIAKTGFIGRRKAMQVRSIASKQGWLVEGF